MNPQSPYAATKAAADQLALSFFRSFDAPVSIIRPFNTYGPRQSARAIIPTIISQILEKNKIGLGSVHTSRDLAELIFKLMQVKGEIVRDKKRVRPRKSEVDR